MVTTLSLGFATRRPFVAVFFNCFHCHLGIEDYLVHGWIIQVHSLKLNCTTVVILSLVPKLVLSIEN